MLPKPDRRRTVASWKNPSAGVVNNEVRFSRGDQKENETNQPATRDRYQKIVVHYFRAQNMPTGRAGTEGGQPPAVLAQNKKHALKKGIKGEEKREAMLGRSYSYYDSNTVQSNNINRQTANEREINANDWDKMHGIFKSYAMIAATRSRARIRQR